MSHLEWQLIQVVPRLTPGRCGVSDQATCLAEELKSEFGIQTEFAVLNSNERCDLAFPIVHCTPRELQQACLSLSNGRPVALLVHVSGYGYSADGAPTVLAEVLQQARSSGRFRIAVYFHELFATGMPWRSAFWHSRRQKDAIRRIAAESDQAATSIRYFADWLEQETVRRVSAPVQVLPVFSGVGEAQTLTPVVQRDQVMTVFGLGATRQRAYKELSHLTSMVHELGIKEILDIGPECEVPSRVDRTPVRCLGALSAAELGRQLSRTQFGFVSYRAPFLARSSVFAGYCAQGAIPVIPEPFRGDVDGLRDGIHLLSPGTAHAVDGSGLEQCSRAAWSWYAGHTLNVHAANYANWLDQLAAGSAGEMRIPTTAQEV